MASYRERLLALANFCFAITIASTFVNLPGGISGKKNQNGSDKREKLNDNPAFIGKNRERIWLERFLFCRYCDRIFLFDF